MKWPCFTGYFVLVIKDWMVKLEWLSDYIVWRWEQYYNEIERHCWFGFNLNFDMFAAC